ARTAWSAGVTGPTRSASPYGILRTFSPDSAAQPESTTFLQYVSIYPNSGCGNPICPTDSIRVWVGGSFPSDCNSVRQIDLYESPVQRGAGIIPRFPPWVRVVVDSGACGRPSCNPGRYPWSGGVVMPPLSRGTHALNIAVIVLGCR